MTKIVDMENTESGTEPRIGVLKCLLIAAARGRALRRMRETKPQADATGEYGMLGISDGDHPVTS